PTLYPGDNPLEGCVVGALPAITILVADVNLDIPAVQDRLLCLCRQVRPGHVGTKARRLAERLQQAAEVLDRVSAGPWPDRALVERFALIGNDELGVDLHPRTETGALRTGSERRDERERRGRELLEGRVGGGGGEGVGGR